MAEGPLLLWAQKEPRGPSQAGGWWSLAGSGWTPSKKGQHASVGLCGGAQGVVAVLSTSPQAYSQLPLVVSPEEGVRGSSHSKVTAPCVHQDIQLEKEERQGGS